LREPGRVLHDETEVPADTGPLLERLVGWLGAGGAQVSVRYPGVWLDDRVWATHGHYLDRHLLPESAFGLARGLLGRLPRDGAVPMDYEQRQSVTSLEGPLGRFLPRWLSARLDDVVAALRRTTTIGMQARPLPDSAVIPRLRSHVLGLQMLRASVPALARVVHRLGVDADVVIFGHVHRLGPLPDDARARWAGPAGAPRIFNTGSWVHEPLLLHRAQAPHAYWPGGAIELHDGSVTARAFLDDVGLDEIAPDEVS